MQHSFIVSITFGLLSAIGLSGCNENSDAKSLQGAWTLASGEKDGEPLPEQDIKDSKLTIVGDTYTVQVGAMTLKGTQKLDATKSPKQIDAHDTEGPNVGEYFGIYELTPAGDFRVCFAPTGKERPTEFVTTPGSGQFIHVWRRASGE